MNNEQKFRHSWNTLPWTSKTCDEENILNLVHWRKRDFRWSGLEVGYTIVSRTPPPPNFPPTKLSPFGVYFGNIEDGFLFRISQNRKKSPLMWAVGLISGFLHVLLTVRIYSKMGAPKSKYMIRILMSGTVQGIIGGGVQFFQLDGEGGG